MITLKDLEAYLWGAANLLRGMIDAADFKQYIFPMLFYKRLCDVYDEEYSLALKESCGSLEFAGYEENHRFQIPKGYHWEDIRKETKDVGIKFQKALREIEKKNANKLHGIFGDAQWSNKNRFTDEKMVDLVNHFSSMKLTLENVPADEFGTAYEYLIKKFADDSGHTAAEFYTNRTVVQLMTLILEPQPAEAIYDPTCGTGGMLLNCVLQLKNAGKEYRNVVLKGQELNLITSAIARMNMIIHDVDDFEIAQGDTLDHPSFIKEDRLETFHIILANPPYSVKRWNRKKWLKDPYGRNIWGTPPQGCADYAFIQHIYHSLEQKKGRAAILLPHGVLFRDNEAEIRRKMVEMDVVDAVIGLGPNLFYNSSMESCILILRNNKQKDRKGKILFINAVNEVHKERSDSYLEREHIDRIVDAYQQYQDVDAFAKVATKEQVLGNSGNLSIRLYTSSQENKPQNDLSQLYNDLQTSSENMQKSMEDLFHKLQEIGIEADRKCV
ncbi:MAG: SAM-dependent DNA methyltransferase [Candidatus Brocadiae bacterium]|nr:SAM-dependent DNA methyltransferase [Candidatus Brocadiia bacterium]